MSPPIGKDHFKVVEAEARLPSAEAARLYGDGLTLRQIADQYGVHEEGVRQRLIGAGVDRRSHNLRGPMDGAPVFYAKPPAPIRRPAAHHCAALVNAMNDIALAHGFAAMDRAVAEIREALARANRAQLEAEGWIV